jgi:hypothetical protein
LSSTKIGKNNKINKKKAKIGNPEKVTGWNAGMC